MKEKILSFEEAANVVEEMKKKDMKAEAKKADRPISIADEQDRKKFLYYAIGLLKERELIKLLQLRINGWSYKKIAWEYGRIKPCVVKRLESIALDKVMNIIRAKHENCIPLLGGL